MARSRNIKPGLFANELLGEADPLTVLAFVGLWTLADKEGRLECRPKKIRAQLFPYRPDIDINSSLEWLMNESFISCYCANDESYIQILNWSKHQSPHHKEIDSTIPAEVPSCKKVSPRELVYTKQQHNHAQSNHDSSMIQEQVKESASTPLIPDSLLLIPDPLNSDSLCTESPMLPATTKQSLAPKRLGEAKSTATWEAYRKAYNVRYGVDPSRNAKISKHLCAVVDRIGADDAPKVAAFFLTHNGKFYVARMHGADLLMQDCEKLRTEWLTNRTVTQTEAQQLDQKQNNLSVGQQVLESRRQRGKIT